ncbi:acyltransferase family protein [Chitinophaga nivalis]|uniref:Acyltransferase n=1 Tax=Chitinophaga nivalis TaxID=2991709 RepID=A0ABT3IPB6_9BACT|nr:acyltransferase [Chitinophaga nivalis]MCW3485804.1 acyltransferase [Chitinophaga nivalis]
MNKQLFQPDPLKTKQHFEILDGLRGIAALTVVVFHFMEMVYEPSKNFVGHGFLAVDFFFCLSGFVIGYAYDQRMGQMGLTAFFKSRIIRLHPLVILGSVLGLLAFLFDPFGDQATLYSGGKVLLLFLASALMIPFPVMPERSFNLFSLNAPAWSLFWEYVANIVYAFVLVKISRRWLVGLTICAAAILSAVAYRAGNVMGGWGKESFPDGGARIFYSFLAGLLIFRFNLIIKNKLGFVGLTVLLLMAFMMPYGAYNWLAELLVVLCYFPLLISLGAGAILTPGLKNICEFSGKISYPIYMTHYAVIWIFSNYYNSHHPNTTQLTVIIITGTLLLIGFAYAAMIAFDIPVRKYLQKRWLKK